MFAKVHPPEDVQSGNKGSCADLVQYLDKEQGEGHYFFSHTTDHVPLAEVILDIDNNKKSLGKEDAKFFMLSLNPSEAEQKHLIGRDVQDLSELTPQERQKVFEKLEVFTRKAMDNYALNFGREKIRSGADLMYYARVETQRKYKLSDEAVKAGTAKVGEIKPGLNFHVHILVSRKSMDGTVKLSPNVKSTGNTWVLENQGTVKRGFCHEKWKVDVQETFNTTFHYQAKEGDIYIRKNNTQASVIAKVQNQDLHDLLQNYRFASANQIVAAMRERGYEHYVRKGVHTFNKGDDFLQVEHSALKPFEILPTNEELKSIADRFDITKLKETGRFEENGLIVKNINFSTLKPNEKEGEKVLKSVSYQVVYDEQHKITVALSTVKQYAYENKINLVKTAESLEMIIKRVKNADLRDLLQNYQFTASNQIVAAMCERGYEHHVKKGIHTFEKEGDRVSIKHKDLDRFVSEVDRDMMKNVIDRFNLYKYKQELNVYSENNLKAKTIEFYTYVKEPIEKDISQDRQQPEETGKEQAGENDPEKNRAGLKEQQITPDMPEEKETEQKYRKVLKHVQYDVVYDEQNRITIPVSMIRKFAYENEINLYDRFKHSYAVRNTDLRECLQNPELVNVRQIHSEMRKKGYTVNLDKDSNVYVYERNGETFTMARRDLLAFTNYARSKNDYQDRGRSGEAIGAGMVGNHVKQKISNAILGDTFLTERKIAGNAKTAIRVIANPAALKMILLKKVANFLNPFKEL